jgi:hypothetical protein
MRQKCSVYLLAGDYIIIPASETSAGMWIAEAPVLRVAGSSTSAALGEAVLEALQRSQTGVPHPTDWPAANREMKTALNAVKVSSFMRLHRQASSVAVDADEGVVTLTPLRNGGYKGPDRGFSGLPSKARRLSRGTSTAEVGAAVVDAFQLCE